MSKAPDQLLKDTAAALRCAITTIYRERHQPITSEHQMDFWETREYISKAIMRVRQLEGILEARAMKGGER